MHVYIFRNINLYKSVIIIENNTNDEQFALLLMVW